MTRFYCKFLAESKDEINLKIGQYLPKLSTNNIVGLFQLKMFMTADRHIMTLGEPCNVIIGINKVYQRATCCRAINFVFAPTPTFRRKFTQNAVKHFNSINCLHCE